MTFDDAGIYVPGTRPDPEFEGAHAPAQPGLDTLGLGGTAGIARPMPNLDTVFDDPDHGEVGRDQLLVHILWEVVLLIAVAAAGLLLLQEDTRAFSGDALRTLALSAAVLGTLTLAGALSLRAAAPNLAIGAVAVTAGLWFGDTAGTGLLRPLLVVVAGAAVVGLVQGLFVTLLHVPAWAGGLAVAVALAGWSATWDAVAAPTSLYDPRSHTWWWAGGVAVVSIVASAIGAIPPIRRGLARFRPVADPARRRGVVAAIIVILVTIGSSALAAVAGVLALGVSRVAVPSTGIELTALATGVALVGGTSAFGRRGGFLGTILAVALATIVTRYLVVMGWSWPTVGIAAVTLAVGLLVTRLVERFGRPSTRPRKHAATSTGVPPAGAPEPWEPVVHSSATNPRGWPIVPQSGPPPTTTGGLWATDATPHPIP